MAEFSTITLLKLTLDVMSISENGKITSAPITPLNMIEVFVMDFTMLFWNVSRIPGFANYASFLYCVLNIFPLFLLFLSLPFAPMPLLFLPYNRYMERTAKPS